MKQLYILIFVVAILGSTPKLLISQINPIVTFQKISNTQGGFGNCLNANDLFGNSNDSIGDIDGDGITDVVISSFGDDEMGTDMGAIYILKLNSNGSVKSSTKITKNMSGFTGNIQSGDIFGSGFAALGDINGDGFQDVAVGAEYDDDGGTWNGAIYLLSLDTSGSVLNTQKISALSGGFTGILSGTPAFGCDIANIGDLNGDGVQDLAVGSRRDNDGTTRAGAVWILFMNANGTVHHHKKISSTQGNLTANLGSDDFFGVSVENLGDLDNDGHIEIAVGCHFNDDGGTDRGSIYILSLDTGGTVLNTQKISSTAGNFSNILSNGDKFGVSIAKIGDLDNDGVVDIAVGAYADHTVGSAAGAMYILYLNANGTVKSHLKITEGLDGFTGDLDAGDRFGVSISSIGKYGDLYALLVGARGDDDGVTDAGAAYVLFIRAVIYADIDNVVLNDEFIYNNPVKDRFFIQHHRKGLSLSIFDMNGRKVKHESFIGTECNLNCSDLAKGMYIAVMEGEGYRKTVKIIKE